MRRGPAIVVIAATLALFGGLIWRQRAQAASPFADWAAVVVAGDDRAHDGSPSEGFDNARHDVAQDLVELGFQPQNMRQFSVRPELYPAEHLMTSDPELIGEKLAEVASQARGGCLVYFSSHGSPEGVVVGVTILSPGDLSQMVDAACGDRPTVVVISACFSGVFVPALERGDRMVLTAARPDRTSFGCGQSDRYPYFDACVLETLPSVGDFAALGRQVQACVAAKEKATGMSPPSEPQMFVGAELKAVLPFYPLTGVSAPAASQLSPGRRTP